MICPFCGNEETKVLETRETSDIETRRRRECLACAKRFTTYERLEQKPLFVIKKGGNRELFDPEKIVKGLIHSCQKRPVSLQDIETIVKEVEEKIRSSNEEEIKSAKIGSLVMSRLKKLDKISYIRFASVYRDFADIDEFKEEISKLKNK
jgi:transcriptional repressor NrdR